MRQTSTPPPLRFERQVNPVPGNRHHRWVVSFLRGGVLDCASEAEACAMTASHLARARRGRVEDRVVSAVWLTPDWKRKTAP
jgi:hypothetical protein